MNSAIAARPLRTRPRAGSYPRLATVADTDALGSLRLMKLIREFERGAYHKYTTGHIGGFCHLCDGQEAVAVGVASLFEKERDYFVGGYRNHGHALALGMPARLAMAEFFGKASGCCKGKGGSIHFFDAANHNLGGHAIVGAQAPIGTGAAFACKYKNTGGVCFVLLGDGALNQGAVHEAMNLASLWKLPCIFVVENNGFAMGTSVDRSSAQPGLVTRGRGYAMPCVGVDGTDLDEIVRVLSVAVHRARIGDGASYIVASTYRFRGHSMSDPQNYRTRAEVDQARLRDPISLYQRKLLQLGLISHQQIGNLEEEITHVIEDAIKYATQSSPPDLGDRFDDVLSESYPLLQTSRSANVVMYGM